MKACKYLFVSVFLLISTTQFAQVRDIKDKVKEDRQNKRGRGYTYSPETTKSRDDDDTSSVNSLVGLLVTDVVGELVAGAAGLIAEAQYSTLEDKDLFPERVSLEAPLNFGLATTNGATNYNLGLRGNWGIFATDFKYTQLNDRQDDLKNIEWVIGMIRIPIENLKLDYGLGFNRVLDLSTTYLKSHVGFDLRIQKTNVAGYYEWTGKTSLGSRFKQNVTIRLDHEVGNVGKLRFSPMLQYEYQNYFSSTEFHFINGGVVVRFF